MKERIRQLLRRAILWACPEIGADHEHLRMLTKDYAQSWADGFQGGPIEDALEKRGSPAPGAHAHKSAQNRIPGAHVWVLAALALGSLFFATGMWAQQGGQTSSTPPLVGNGAPAGSCGVASIYVDYSTGNLYDCNGGTWLKVNGSGGGSGCVPPGTHTNAFLIDSGTGTCPDFGGFAASSHNFLTGLSNAGVFSQAQPAFSDISGTWAVGQAPASANSCATHQFTISLASGFNVTCAQPVAADIGSIPGTSGQLLFNNAGAIGAEDPVVSANQPAATTQTITATGALAGVTITADGMALVTISGTYAGVAFNFEGTPDGTFSPAFPVTASQVDAISTVTASGALPSNATRSWFVKAPGHTKIRLNVTAYTSGTANVTITPMYYQLSDGANVNIANSPSVSVSNFPATQPISAASLPLPSGAATSANQCGFSGTPCEVSKDTSVNSATDPLFAEPTDGTAAMGAMANFGTSPGAVKALNANASCFVATTACPNDGTAGVQAVGGHLSDNGAAAAANRTPQLPGIYQTDYANGSAGTQGRDAAAEVGTDGLLWTAQLPAMRPESYHTSANFAASSTTDNFVFPGNASNTVLITKVTVSCTQTTAGIVLMKVIKRSTADTSGTSSAVTPVPDDSNYSAAVSAPLSYTGTGPTVGTAVGTVDEYYLGCLAAGTASPNDIYILNLRQKPIVLRGTAQQLAINFGGALTGGNLNVTIEHMETKTITP